jgi:Rrf2 family protein
MKLSNKGRYGVQALFDIAFHNDGRPTQIREIAEREVIPARFLEQIFQDLKKAGLLGSKRGPRGGYHLARPASEISVGDVIRALEGPAIVQVPSLDAARGPKPRGRGRSDDAGEGNDAADATTAIFQDLALSVERCFDAVTIADVCARGAALGLHRRARARASYAI